MTRKPRPGRSKSAKPAPANPHADANTVLQALDPTETASLTQIDGAPPPRRIQAIIRKAQGSLPMALFRRFLDADLIGQAAALAFYAVLSLAPMMMMLLWLTASAAPSAQDLVMRQIQLLVGQETELVARTIVDNARAAPDTGSVAGWWSIALLTLGATAVFAQLQDVLNRIFRTDATALDSAWAWLRKRVFSFGVVLALGFLLLVSLAVTTVLEVVFARIDWMLPTAATLASLVVYALAFAFMYHFMPDRRVRWRLALVGGSLTAAMFVLGRAAIAWYLEHASTASAYGGMGALVLTMLWVYYAAIILFVGALITAVIDERMGAAAKGRKGDVAS